MSLAVPLSADAIRASLRDQAVICRMMRSPLTAAVIDAAAERLDESSETGRRVLGWPGDPSPGADVLALRLAGGFHALARSGRVPLLSVAYAAEGAAMADAVSAALEAEDGWLAGWLDSPPQTNEAGRAAAIMAGLCVAAERFGLPFDLHELGSSAGLVLNLARYRYDLGGHAAGDPASPLRIAPEWRGAPPPDADVRIRTARGVDLRPVPLADDGDAERLIAYVWPDQPERLARVEAAIAIARAHPPRIDRGDAADWAEASLAETPHPGTMRVLFHTIAFQYFPEAVQARVRAAIATAGARATAESPLGWLFLEFDKARARPELHLRLWPGGEAFHLADAHPHCSWIEWRG